jgi:hypothetical protein
VQPCVAGTWSKAQATQCILAEPGYYPNAGQTGQTICANGDYSYGQLPSCSQCPKGHECTFGKTAVPCPIFFWSAAGAQDCSPCPAGQDCQNLKDGSGGVPAMNAWVNPVTCAAGFYTMPHNFYCVPCPIGHSCAAGALVPTKCPAGKYAGQQQSSCTNCPAEYGSNEGEEYCTPIPPGMKKSTSTVVGFEVCPHETYSMWGEESCTTCPDGYLCAKGHNYPNNWQYSCPRGSWCNNGKQYKCPKGYFGVMERAKT